jgi:hypothetical protein
MYISKNKRRKGDGGAGDKNGPTKYTTRKENKCMLQASVFLMEVDAYIMENTF